MGIGIEGERRLSMAQDSREGLGIHSAGQSVGSEGVTEIVKANAGQPCPFQQRFQVIVGGAGTGGLLWLEWIWEDPLGVGTFFPLSQELCRAGRQGDGPFSCARLGLACDQPATPLDMERPADREGPMVLIEVVPHEAADLSPPKAGGQLSVEEVVPVLAL